MVGTIGSVGHGADQQAQRIWWRLWWLYVAGSIVGGILLGGTVGILGEALEAMEQLMAVRRIYVDGVGLALMVLLMLRDLGIVRLWLPSRDRQVPLAWKRLPGYWSPFVYGLSLGTGVSTTVYLGSFYASLIVALLFRDLLAAILVGVIYALGRAILIFVSVHSKGGPEGLAASLAPRTSLVARVNGLIILVTVAVIGIGLNQAAR